MKSSNETATVGNTLIRVSLATTMLIVDVFYCLDNFLGSFNGPPACSKRNPITGHTGVGFNTKIRIIYLELVDFVMVVRRLWLEYRKPVRLQIIYWSSEGTSEKKRCCGGLFLDARKDLLMYTHQ